LETIASLDEPTFTNAFSQYWTPFPTTGPAKYLDLNVWLRQAAFRYLLTGLDAMPAGRRLLDLGAGAGYFPLVCRHEGHRPLTLDVDDEPLYRDLSRFFDLPRVVHRIEPMSPLPDLGAPFDVITAFRTCFNVSLDGSPWEVDAWRFLLEDLRTRLVDRGRIVLCFNLNPKTGEFYPPGVARLLRRPPGFRSRLFFEYAFLDAG